MHFCVWRCISDVSMERDILHVHHSSTILFSLESSFLTQEKSQESWDHGNPHWNLRPCISNFWHPHLPLGISKGLIELWLLFTSMPISAQGNTDFSHSYFCISLRYIIHLYSCSHLYRRILKGCKPKELIRLRDFSLQNQELFLVSVASPYHHPPFKRNNIFIFKRLKQYLFLVTSM